LLLALVATLLATPARAEADPVTRWLGRHAQGLPALDGATDGAIVVGLGESVHGAHEEATLKLRALKRLVTRMGFRSIAWEEDWTTGRAINRFVTTGHGRLPALVARMTGQWQSRETLRALRWVRAVNQAHPRDPVRFVGVEYYYTGRPAYDAVRRYVAGHAPRLLPALRADLRVIYPDLRDPVAYAAQYAEEPHKGRFIRRAHHLARLVARVPHRPADPAYALVRQHTRQVVAFHEHYSLPPDAQDDYREVHAARTLRWWQQRTHDRVVYWAAMPHTAAAPRLRIALPGAPDLRFRTTGSHLREWYGERYVSVGFTFDHGAVGLRPVEVTEQPPPDPTWLESPFGRVEREAFLVDLEAPAPPAVRRWLQGLLTTRGLPWAPGSTVTGGSPAEWFDVLVHVQRVSPQRQL
jgi:erythromycin esterase